MDWYYTWNILYEQTEMTSFFYERHRPEASASGADASSSGAKAGLLYEIPLVPTSMFMVILVWAAIGRPRTNSDPNFFQCLRFDIQALFKRIHQFVMYLLFRFSCSIFPFSLSCVWCLFWCMCVAWSTIGSDCFSAVCLFCISAGRSNLQHTAQAKSPMRGLVSTARGLRTYC